MSCAEYKDRLLDFALDAARGDAALLAHLESCAACRAELEAQRRIAAAMDRALAEEVAAEPSPEFPARVRRQMEDSGATPRIWLPAWAPVALGLALVTVMVAWIFLRAPSGREPTREIARTTPPEKSISPPRKSEEPEKGIAAPEKSQRERPLSAGPRVIITASARTPEVLVPRGEEEALRQFVRAVRSPRLDLASFLASASPNIAEPLQAPAELKIKPLELPPMEKNSEPPNSVERQ